MTMVRFCRWLAPLSCLLATEAASRADQPTLPLPAKISEARRDEQGLLVYRVEAECQSGPTEMRVLLPDELDKLPKHRVLYVLPVEAGRGNRYGDGLLEVKRLGLHNKYGLICVAPSFADLPWYADHPTDERIAQEKYFIAVVVPFIERQYPALAEPRGRLLLGFSKSGWGAWTLLLRHPEVFSRAAAWDAPMNIAAPGQFGNGPIFGTQENFDRYRITRLIAEQGPKLGSEPRLALLGYGNFRAHHEAIHRQLDELKVPHEYRDGPLRKHIWESGWIPEAVEFLVGPK